VPSHSTDSTHLRGSAPWRPIPTSLATFPRLNYCCSLLQIYKQRVAIVTSPPWCFFVSCKNIMTMLNIRRLAISEPFLCLEKPSSLKGHYNSLRMTRRTLLTSKQDYSIGSRCRDHLQLELSRLKTCWTWLISSKETTNIA
jgi:hypothetical protein